MSGSKSCVSNLQHYYANWKVFLLVFSIVSAMQMAFFSYMGSMLTSIERQFGFSSSQTGLLMGAYDIVRLPFLLILPYIGRNWHAPRTLSITYIICGLTIMIIGSTRFMVTSSNIELNNQTLMPKQQFCRENVTESTQDVVTTHGSWIFAVWYLALGVTGSTQFARNSIFYSFIYENSPARLLPFIIGVLSLSFKLGSLMGYGLSTWCNHLHVSISETDLSPTDPNWIGAWWVGFLVIGASMTCLSPILLLFPRRLTTNIHNKTVKSKTTENDGSRDYESRDNRKSRDDVSIDAYESGERESILRNYNHVNTPSDIEPSGQNTQNNCNTRDNSLTLPECRYIQYKEIAKPDIADQSANSIRHEVECEQREREGTEAKVTSFRGFGVIMMRMLRDHVFILLLCASTTLAYYQGGFTFYQVKYYENEFKVPAWRISLMLGLGKSTVFGVAAIFYGILSSRFNLSFRGMASMCAVCAAIGAAVFAPALFVSCHTLQYDVTTRGPSLSRLSISEPLNDCNRDCNCATSAFTPVLDGSMAYFSACHAGCHNNDTNGAQNLAEYWNCSCTDSGSARDLNLTEDCNLWLPLFLVSFLPAFVNGVISSAHVVLFVRCVDARDQSVAMGFVRTVVSVLGWMPAFSLFGAVIDTSCIVWAELPDGSHGNCWAYDDADYRYKFIGLGLAVFIITFIFMMLVAIFSKNSSSDRENENLNGKVIDEEITIDT